MKNKNKIMAIFLAICLALSIIFSGYNISEKYKIKHKYVETKQINKKLSAKNKYLMSENKRIRSLYMDQAHDQIDLQDNYTSLKGEYDFLYYKYKDLQKKYKKLNKSLSLSNSNNSDSSNSDSTSSSTDGTVYITDYGNKYHTADCKYLKKSSIPISKSEAKQRGYSACSECNP